MPSLRHCSIFSILICICIWLSAPAGAECWRWVKTQPSSGFDPLEFGYTMAYDEGLGHPVIFAYKLDRYPPYYQQLWHYDGTSWIKTWEGEIIPPHTPALDTYVGLYFDRVRNSLVLIGTDLWGFELSSAYAFEFTGGGWPLLAAYTVASAGTGLAYDTDRKRAVIYGIAFIGSHGWLEFDGAQFYPFKAAYEDPDLRGGSSGYDPVSRRIVYRGFYNYIDNDIKTFEYDGITWTEVNTPHNLPGRGWSPGRELCYIPQLGGLLAKPNDIYVLPETWIYKDHDWHKLSLDAELFSDFYEALMTYDPIKQVVILLGFPTHEPFEPTTWEMRHTKHCRPLKRP